MADPSSDLAARGYTIIETLSSNPEGGRTTYLASDRAGQRFVLKRFALASSSATWSGFQAHERELATLRELSHPRIPRYVDSFATDDGFCLVQEWLDLSPISARTSFEAEEVKAIALSALDILVALQRRLPPVIHRDLKPQNILVDGEGQAYLVDFGLARAGAGTGSTMAVGTPGFIAPEQILGRELGPQTDLYGLGATLFAMLTGTPTSELGALVDHSMRFDLELLPPGLDPAFVRWLGVMLAPNPADRHADAAAARDALVGIEIIGSRSPAATTASIPLPPAPRIEHEREPTASPAARFNLVRHVASVAVPILGSIGIALYFTGIPRCSGTLGVPPMTSSPLLVDVDGDGDDELVYRSTSNGESKLVALQTPEHEILWSTEIGNGDVFMGPGLILQKVDATLVAYDIEDGEQRWSVTLSDELSEVYADEQNLWVACTDERYHTVAVDSGVASHARPEPPASMTKILGNWRDRGLKWREHAAHDWGESWAGLQIKRSYCRAADRREQDQLSSCAASSGVAYAVKSPGTSVPYIVGFERPSGSLRWRQPAVSEGERETLFGDDLQLGLDEDRAYVFVQTNVSIIDRSYRVFALDLETGELAWDHDFAMQDEFNEIVVTNELLYIRSGFSKVVVLDKHSGERKRW